VYSISRKIGLTLEMHCLELLCFSMRLQASHRVAARLTGTHFKWNEYQLQNVQLLDRPHTLLKNLQAWKTSEENILASYKAILGMQNNTISEAHKNGIFIKNAEGISTRCSRVACCLLMCFVRPAYTSCNIVSLCTMEKKSPEGLFKQEQRQICH
jgi:hypothetical protein